MILSTDIWVAALIRRADLAGTFATVARKGDTRSGSVLVKTLDRNTGHAQLFAEALGGDGERVWMQPISSTAESAVDAYIERQTRIDPDLWVVEIQDRDGRRLLTEPVMDS